MSFLTRVKTGGDVRWPEDIARGVPWFPVVGCAIGLVVAGVYAAGRSILPSFVAAAVAVAVGVWVTGAFHEDGLADTADAFGGRHSSEETHRILKDPTLGTYGMTALALAMMLRVGGLAALDGPAAFALLPAAHALSRAGAIGLLTGPVADTDGLGASYASAISNKQLAVSLGVAGAIGVAAIGSVVVPAGAGVAIACLIVGRLAWRRLGGVTGDVLGAAQQAAEIVVLLVGVAGLRGDWLDIPWW